jgi:hypothetical protein
MMERCEEYQYKNSLNIFSLTLGPFENIVKNQVDLPAIESGKVAGAGNDSKKGGVFAGVKEFEKS